MEDWPLPGLAHVKSLHSGDARFSSTTRPPVTSRASTDFVPAVSETLVHVQCAIKNVGRHVRVGLGRAAGKASLPRSTAISGMCYAATCKCRTGEKPPKIMRLPSNGMGGLSGLAGSMRGS